ncbi:hypothetical protein EXN32_24920 [Agrobacterium tumefaciens]|nr:hypothetical protein EXN32_24920 [Agrobacterium tumefaciens]
MVAHRSSLLPRDVILGLVPRICSVSQNATWQMLGTGPSMTTVEISTHLRRPASSRVFCICDRAMRPVGFYCHKPVIRRVYRGAS